MVPNHEYDLSTIIMLLIMISTLVVRRRTHTLSHTRQIYDKRAHKWTQATSDKVLPTFSQSGPTDRARQASTRGLSRRSTNEWIALRRGPDSVQLSSTRLLIFRDGVKLIR